MSTPVRGGALLLLIAGLVAATLLPGTAHAATPEFVSVPPETVTVGKAYRYVLQAADSDAQQLTYGLQNAPAGMTLENTVVYWQPTVAGSYAVSATATDPDGQADLQSWHITVLPDEPAIITISPNDRPTTVAINDTQTFSATVTDQFGNELSNANVTWDTDAQYGTITKIGVFTGTKGGITYVTASLGNASATAGVVVTGTASTADEQPVADPAAGTTTTASPPTSPETVASNEEAAENETDDASTLTTEGVPLATGTTTESSATCTNPNHWFLMAIMAVFALGTAGYLWWERQHPHRQWWWLLPLLLMSGSLTVYFTSVCSGSYAWWPWVTIGLTVIAVTGFKARRQVPIPPPPPPAASFPFKQS